MKREIAEKIKAATVGIGVLGSGDRGRPFFTIGSGFCVDRQGIIVTCRHVLEALNSKTFTEIVKTLPPSDTPVEVPDLEYQRPQILFYGAASETRLNVATIEVEAGWADMDGDIAAIRIPRHALYAEGYPTLDFADYKDLYEGMEVGTCGFPLGNSLEQQIGTTTSSFTFGRLSSIAPAQGVPEEVVKWYQLDITATHGNSGGPVFVVETGQVLGALQGGIFGSDKKVMPGIAKASPLYKLTGDDRRVIEKLKTAQP